MATLEAVELDFYCINVGLPEVAELSRQAEAAGIGKLWFAETAHNPFLACAVAATSTARIGVGTNIAVAFPRSPMVVAQTAWDLAQTAQGRFSLGLGTQVKAHIERRYSVPFSHPGPRIRDYVLALRAVWAAFATGGPLRYEGAYYAFSLLTEFFNPGPIEHPDIPVYLAGVNNVLIRTAGEVADGLAVHPLHSPAYLDQVIRPNLDAGAARAGKPPGSGQLVVPFFAAVSDQPAEVEQQRELIRRQIAFYGSTRSYQPVFDLHGWGDLTPKLHALMAKGDQEAMTRAVPDEVLDAFSVTATWDTVAAALAERYQGLTERIYPYDPLAGSSSWSEAAERWGTVAGQLRAVAGEAGITDPVQAQP